MCVHPHKKEAKERSSGKFIPAQSSENRHFSTVHFQLITEHFVYHAR